MRNNRTSRKLNIKDFAIKLLYVLAGFFIGFSGIRLLIAFLMVPLITIKTSAIALYNFNESTELFATASAFEQSYVVMLVGLLVGLFILALAKLARKKYEENKKG